MTDNTLQERMDELHAAELLYRHNKWRRGDESYDMANPTELGVALDMAVTALRRAQPAPAAGAAKYKSIADLPKELLTMIERDCDVAEVLANKFIESPCHLGLTEDAFHLANIAIDTIKARAIAALPATSVGEDEAVEIMLRAHLYHKDATIWQPVDRLRLVYRALKEKGIINA